MNFGIFLLILSFNNVILVFCTKTHGQDHDNCSLCTVSFFRRKRALSEYTRWRSNPETTQEFIVKVLEDDLTTPNPKQIVAVNIRPYNKGEEKIIIGGAAIPSTIAPNTPPDEYTRFVPPTTLALTRFDDLVLAPATVVKSERIPPIKPKNKLIKGEQKIGPIIKVSRDRYALRDESPPSGPKFIPRSNIEFLSQYAPIAPVVFTKPTTIAPLTPRTQDRFILYKTTIRPTRTTVLLDIIVPRRTSEFLNIASFADDEFTRPHVFVPTRTSYSEDFLSSTTEKQFIDDNSYDIIKTTKEEIDSYRRKSNKDNKILDQVLEKEDSYNMIIYADETDISTKKVHVNDYDDETSEKSDMNTEGMHFKTSLSYAPNDDLDEYDNTTDVDVKADYNEEDDLNKGTTLTSTVASTETSETRPKILKQIIATNRSRICNLLRFRQLSFSSPRTLHEITVQLKKWAEESPIARLVDITDGNYTAMENPIYMIIVDDPSSGQIMSAKQTVMIVAGIQGRDHHAVAAAMYVLYQLIERTETHADLLTKYRFWIVPVFNPDGYDYSMTFPRRREWTKNLRQTWDSCKGRDSCQRCELYGIMCTIQQCYGVHLDRNFEYQWIPHEELRSEHPCGSLYSGPRQLSEAETRALTHYLHEQKTPLYTFIAFKEGDVLGIMYPYSHTRKKRAFDHVYRQRASRAASAAYSISGRPYVAGQTSEFLPLYAGGIEDWVDGHLGIDNTYTVMLFRPTDSYSSKLLTERVVHEAYAAVDTLLLQSVEPLGPPPVTLTRSRALSSHPPLLHSFIILIYTVLKASKFI